MSEPTKIDNVLVFENVSMGDLSNLLNENKITLKEFYQILETGKFENDRMKIYKTKNNKR